jgi:hypothetical protein
MYTEDELENYKDELMEEIEEYLKKEIKDAYIFVRVDSLEDKIGIKIVPDPDCDDTLKILNIDKNYGLSINIDIKSKEILGYSLVDSSVYRKIFPEIKQIIRTKLKF